MLDMQDKKITCNVESAVGKKSPYVEVILRYVNDAT